ncbi:MAG: c-type cytochrome [Gammaproteobacteria bacterium]|nr:c-type cytochrome [Gammaproteobacteria bacterium]
MPELSPNFWHGWIVGLTVLSLLALLWLTVSVYFSRRAQGGPDDVVWDDDLREETNPAPWWWFALLLGLLVFTVLYLMLYPGLGDYPGMLRWTQETQIQQSAARDQDKNAARRARWQGMTAAELGADAAAMRTAGRLFRHNCAACHAEDAGGIPGIAPDLTDHAWNWGGSEAQIRQTITAGRTGLMPPLGAALGEEGITEVAEFVLNGLDRADGDGGDGAGNAGGVDGGDGGADSGRGGDGGVGGDASVVGGVGDGGDASDVVAAGRTKYAQFCAACHGPGGKGNPALGAPDLTDEVWFYGNTPAAIRAAIRHGRRNQMPAQGQRLTETQLRLLVAYLLRHTD